MVFIRNAEFIEHKCSITFSIPAVHICKFSLKLADRSQAGVEGAIDQVPTISILFVDSSRLEAMANDLKARLHTYTG